MHLPTRERRSWSQREFGGSVGVGRDNGGVVENRQDEHRVNDPTVCRGDRTWSFIIRLEFGKKDVIKIRQGAREAALGPSAR